MADFENGPSYRFLLDFMATEEDPSLGYIFFRAVNIFSGLSVPDPSAFPSVQHLEIILSCRVHYQLHHVSSPVD